jgi:hypothetical protein
VLRYRFRPAAEAVTAGTIPYSGSINLTSYYLAPTSFAYETWANYNIGNTVNVISALTNGQDYVWDIYIDPVVTKLDATAPDFVISDDYQKLGHSITTPFSIPFTKAEPLPTNNPGIEYNGKISYDIDGVPFFDGTQNQFEAPYASIDTSGAAWWNFKVSALKKDTIGTLMYTGNRFTFEYDDTKFDVTAVDVFYKVKKATDPLINEGFKFAGKALPVFTTAIPLNAGRTRRQVFEATGLKIDLLDNLRDTTNYVLELFYKPIYTNVGAIPYAFELATFAQAFGRNAIAPFGIPLRTGVRAAGFRAKFGYITNTTPFISSEVNTSVEPYNTAFDSFDTTAVVLTPQGTYYSRTPDYNHANSALNNSLLDSLFINDIRTSVVLDTTLGKITKLRAFYKVRLANQPVTAGRYTQLGYDLNRYGHYDAPFYGGTGVRVIEYGTPVVGFKIKNYGNLPNTDNILDTLANTTNYALDVYFKSEQGEVLSTGRSLARLTPIQGGKRQINGYSPQFPFTIFFNISANVLSLNNISVNAVHNGTSNVITWTSNGTATIFTLQKSTDGINFVNIYTGSNKQFIDVNSASNTTVHYRVFTTNINNRNEYSPIVTINKQLGSVTRLFPNPVRNVATLQVAASEKMNVQLDIINMKGEIVNSSKSTLEVGTNNISITALSNLASGTYLVKLTSDNSIIAIQKVFKQ